MQKNNNKVLLHIFAPVLIAALLLAPIGILATADARPFTAQAEETVEDDSTTAIDDEKVALAGGSYIKNEYVVATLFVAVVAVTGAGVLIIKSRES